MANDENADNQNDKGVGEKPPAGDQKRNGIWLEVAEVRFDSAAGEYGCSVILRPDREQPKPVWWPVKEDVLGSKKTPLETYQAILSEMDKKRIVLARLAYYANGNDSWLRCDALRFQSPELGSR